MNELTTIPSLLPPAVDDRLIWETWISKYHTGFVSIVVIWHRAKVAACGA